MIRTRIAASVAILAAGIAAGCPTDGPTAPDQRAAAGARARANVTTTTTVRTTTGGTTTTTTTTSSTTSGASTSISTSSSTSSWANKSLPAFALNTILEAEKRRVAAMQAASKPTYDRLKLDWSRFLATNPSPTASPFLMCDPLQYAATTQIVGPEGGDISVGPHKLSIPRGALVSPTVITAEMPTATNVQVQLSPHGQQFKVGVKLKLSYKHCYRPGAGAKSVIYVDDAMRILEWPLTADVADQGLSDATINHFSGYVVGWSRTSR